MIGREGFGTAAAADDDEGKICFFFFSRLMCRVALFVSFAFGPGMSLLLWFVAVGCCCCCEISYYTFFASARVIGE